MKGCKKFLKLISYSIDGKISKREEELLQNHLKECENCRKEMEEMIKIKKELRNIETILPEKATLKLKKIRIGKAYKFNIFTFLPLLFSLIFFVLVFFLWQNLKQKQMAYCLEIKENKKDIFPILINRIYLKKDAPADFYILFEIEIKNKEKIFKILETNYENKRDFFEKEIKKIEFENFKERKYLIKIYKCP